MTTVTPKWVAQPQFEVDDSKPLAEMMRCTGALLEYHPDGDGVVDQEKSIFVPGDDETVTALTRLAEEFNLALHINKRLKDSLDAWHWAALVAFANNHGQ